MILLALDASTESLNLAVLRDGDLIAHRQEPGGPQASQRLLPAVADCLDQAGASWASLGAVAAAVGPGAFTGLRSACATAQGLALGLGLPVVPVDSLSIVAEGARQTLTARGDPSADSADLRCAVAVDARMGQVYAAVYRLADGHWLAEDEPVVADPDAVVATWLGLVPAPPVWAGSGLSLMAQDHPLPAGQAGTVFLHEEPDRAAALGVCAWAAWRRQGGLDPSRLVPHYVRDRVALTTEERLAARLERA